MRLETFQYHLPPELIAQKPLERRDESRMMVVDRASGAIRHGRFRDFPDYLKAGDLLVINRSRVMPARVWGRRGESRIEFLFLRETAPGKWEVLCRPARKVRLGDRVDFDRGLSGVASGRGRDGLRVLDFGPAGVRETLEEIGFAPLPPYIKRGERHRGLRDFDLERYQTVFAEGGSSIAAPTAGLHFTAEMLDRIEARGVVTAPISLDVGLATFQPVREPEIENHTMLEENFSVPEESAALINRALAEGRPVTAVGTTSVRTLESSVDNRRVRAGERSTRLFIRPGYTFQVVGRLLTNFHLPGSTLLMLTAAFGGLDLILSAYREAVEARYRFFSYGDCMLIL